ncbi:hypothetical protein Bhyg_10769 [Pseudolycoriella hygida]|uniref:Uncharacterized protein n=1 Tax=Pseudolycoriella hygida TaxID=35572 RepID=A0A9Q0MU50_9DIPT|nr:hypothetical protein Bhyg_10769 [Pseudolycoriella hygida]
MEWGEKVHYFISTPRMSVRSVVSKLVPNCSYMKQMRKRNCNASKDETRPDFVNSIQAITKPEMLLKDSKYLIPPIDVQEQQKTW